MPSQRRQIGLGFVPGKVDEGQHICFIYNSDTERIPVIARYLAHGVRDGEKVLCLVDSMTPETMIDCLTEYGITPGQCPQDVDVRPALPAYCPSGQFRPAEMLGVIRDYYNDARQAGYAGARGTGEMSWSLRNGATDTEQVMEYEAGLTGLVREHPYTACCQYDARQFDGQTILDVLSVHPVMILRGQLVKNPFYLEPTAFLETYRERKRRLSHG
jgi:hypothetical protein